MARRKSRRRRSSPRKRLIWVPFNRVGQNNLVADNVNDVSRPVLLAVVTPAQLGNFAEYTLMASNIETGVYVSQADEGNVVSVWIGATLLDPETVQAELDSPGSQTLPGFWTNVGGPNEQSSTEPWFWLDHHWATALDSAVAPPSDAPGVNTRTSFFPGKSKRVVEQGDQIVLIGQAGHQTGTLDSIVTTAVDGRWLLQYSP